MGFLWYRGQLTSASIADIRLVLTGDDGDSFDIDESAKQDQPSIEDVAEDRTMRILELSTREEELAMLKSIVTGKRKDLDTDQDGFKAQKEGFEKELKELEKTAVSEATEQTRGILLALQPADAIDSLMGLAIEENVVLLKGMPEKSTAKILQQFLIGDDDEKKRGQEIFKEISQGNPSKMLIGDSFNGLLGNEPPEN